MVTLLPSCSRTSGSRSLNKSVAPSRPAAVSVLIAFTAEAGAKRFSAYLSVAERALVFPQPLADFLEHLHGHAGMLLEHAAEVPRGDGERSDRSLGDDRSRARPPIQQCDLAEEGARAEPASRAAAYQNLDLALEDDVKAHPGLALLADDASGFKGDRLAGCGYSFELLLSARREDRDCLYKGHKLRVGLRLARHVLLPFPGAVTPPLRCS